MPKCKDLNRSNTKQEGLAGVYQGETITVSIGCCSWTSVVTYAHPMPTTTSLAGKTNWFQAITESVGMGMIGSIFKTEETTSVHHHGYLRVLIIIFWVTKFDLCSSRWLWLPKAQHIFPQTELLMVTNQQTWLLWCICKCISKTHTYIYIVHQKYVYIHIYYLHIIYIYHIHIYINHIHHIYIYKCIIIYPIYIYINV